MTLSFYFRDYLYSLHVSLFCVLLFFNFLPLTVQSFCFLDCYSHFTPPKHLAFYSLPILSVLHPLPTCTLQLVKASKLLQISSEKHGPLLRVKHKYVTIKGQKYCPTTILLPGFWSVSRTTKRGDKGAVCCSDFGRFYSFLFSLLFLHSVKCWCCIRTP